MESEKIIIGQFNDTFVPIMDGVGNVARNYAYWLNKKYGFCCAVVPQVPKYKDVEEFPVIRFMSLPIPGKEKLRLGIPKLDPAVQKRLSKIEFTLLHTHCPFTSGELALKMAQERRIPVVTTFHSKYREDFKDTFKTQGMIDWAMKKIMKFYNTVDFIWVPNKGGIEELRDYGFGGDIEVMENGTDLIAPTEEKYKIYRNAGLTKIGDNEELFVMLFVGQHRWIKNIQVILDAAKRLDNRGREFIMLFAGIGEDKSEIKRTVRKYKLEEKIKFLGRIIDREEIKELYAVADLLLFPSLYDTASLVMREAAAFSTPSLVVKGSSTSEGVDHGRNGFISNNNDEDYAALIEHLMDNRGDITSAGEMARKTIYQPWEVIVERVYQRYLELLKEYKKSKQLVL